jgi:hypothetical protein
MPLQILPEAFDYGSSDGDDVVEAQWQKHKGWWLSNGEEDCSDCPEGSVIPEGQLVYLPGDLGVTYCEHHAPVQPPKTWHG